MPQSRTADPFRSRVRAASWLLALHDRLTRALVWAPQPEQDQGSWQRPRYPWLEDLAHARHQVEDALALLGVEPCAHEGEPFDPAYHTTDTRPGLTGLAERRIQCVVQPGCRLGPHVLRKARVVLR